MRLRIWFAPALAGLFVCTPCLAQGVVSAFGDVLYGQAAVPAGLTDAVQIGACRRSVAAVRTDGTIVAWGADANGEVSNVPSPPPGQVFTKVFGGWGFTLFGLTNTGQLVSWGRNSVGQANVPALPAGRRYTKAAAGFFHGVALRDDGTLVSWGANQPTFSTAAQALILGVPALPSGTSWTDFGVGYKVTLGLRSDGQIRAWGIDVYGETAVSPLPPGSKYTALSFSGTFAVALRDDGGLAAWGDDFFAQVSDAPQPGEGTTFVAIYAGTDHAFALDSLGVWQGWGTNFDGEADATNIPPRVQQFVAVGDYNAVLHAPDCFGDLDGSGQVDGGDVSVALLDYGPCPGCPGDVDGSGDVDFGDVALILLSMGPCG